MNIEEAPIGEVFESVDNPRVIRDEKFQELTKSIKAFPEMLRVRPVIVNPDGVVIGGNMRLRAAKEAGLSTIPVIRVSWDEAHQKEFMIKDNVPFGEWDWDILANEWDSKELKDWGLPVWEADENVDYSILDDDLSKDITRMSREVKRSICIEFPNEKYDEAAEVIKLAREKQINIGAELVNLLKSI